MGVNLYEADDEAGSVEWKSGKERWIVTGTHIENERKKKKGEGNFIMSVSIRSV